MRYTRYESSREEERSNQTAGEKRKLEQRRLTGELKKAKSAKALLTEELQKKQLEADSQIFQLEEEVRKRHSILQVS